MIEDQIGKHWNREEAIKDINRNVVVLNKQVQRMMYHIQIEGLGYMSDLELGSLKLGIEQATQYIANEWITLAIGAKRKG